MDNRIDISEVTPQMARAELARREIARRQAAKAANETMPPKKPFQLKDTNFNTTVVNSSPGQATLEKVARPVADAELGYAQGLANIPSGLAQLGVSGVNYLTNKLRRTNLSELITGEKNPYQIPDVPRFHFAPENAASEVGNVISFIGNPAKILSSIGRLPGMSHIT